jgi:protein-tyrosine phosphatase
MKDDFFVSTLIHVHGTFNFRDYAGFPVAGGNIKPSALFRSDALVSISDPEALTRLGINTVVDLRDSDERRMLPNTLPPGMTQRVQPIFPSARAHVEQRLSIYDLTDLIFLRHGEALGRAIREIANAPTGGVLFHCTAGKDRTGAVAALTLAALGAEHGDVFQDYAQSEKNLAGEWLDRYRNFVPDLDEETINLVVSTPAEALEGALHKVEKQYGSVRAYLRQHGVTDGVVETLRSRLVG